jgi:putative spermidine/putrescine transport system permease protein
VITGKDKGSRLLRILAWSGIAFLVLPALVALPVSLTSKRFLSMPDGELSFRHYANLFGSEAWLTSMWQSSVIALTSAAIATVLGTLCAIGLWRISSKASELIRGFLLLPLIIPPIISAMAFYRAWVELGLLDSYTGMIIAHAILSAPIVLITVSASLANFDLRLEQASRNLGASIGTTLWRVVLPSIRPGMLGGAVFAFILSWDEIVVALFIAKFRIFTLPRRMWDGIRENTDPTVAAAAVTLIVVTVAAITLSALFARRVRSTTASKTA